MEPQETKSRGLLNRLWAAQLEYNNKVKQGMPQSEEYWAKQYLLGLVSQVDEVLREINWKTHRKRTHTINLNNLGRELADLTKYVICLWQLYGFGEDEMLKLSLEKTDELAKLYKQEFELAPISEGQPVLITDVDGTLGDWRAAFLQWYRKHGGPVPKGVDNYTTLSLEAEIGIPYSTYAEAKYRFEKTGGYLEIKPFKDAINAIHSVYAQLRPAIFVFTSRPIGKHSRLWADTWQWLGMVGLEEEIRELRMGGEERIELGSDLIRKGHKVVLLEDDPTWAWRAAEQGITVFLRSFAYNRSIISHRNIHRVLGFNDVQILEALL